MKKVVICILCLVFSIVAFARKAVNIVFIGNSITYGATLANPSSEAPPVRVGEMLRDSIANEVNISNCGHSGSTTFDWLPKSSFLNEAINAATKFNTNGGVLIFSMMLGTNDSAESGTNGAPVSTSTYKSNMAKIIAELKKNFPQARFIINYPIWYSPNTHNGATYMQGGLNRLKSYHPIIDDMVKMYQENGDSIFAGNKDAFTFFENNTEYLTAEGGYDGTFYLHPNKKGAIKLAEFWTGTIMQHIKDVADTESIIYRKQLEEAQSLFDRTLAYKPLITNSSVLKSNSITMQGQLSQLIDGNLVQNLQTWPNYGPDTYCYIQAKMDYEYPTEMYFGVTVPGGNYPEDYPAEVKVEASANGTSWTKIATFTLKAKEVKAGLWVYSKTFAYNPAKKYLRFTSMHNASNRAGLNHFAIGEMNVFMPDSANSLYYRNEEVKVLADNLKKGMVDFQKKYDEGTINNDDVVTLKKLYNELYNHFETADKVAMLIDSARMVVNREYYAKSAGLIKQLSQIKTNASDNSNPKIPHNLENMFDGNINTVYQTWPNYPANAYCYLQFNLKDTPVKTLFVMMRPYQEASFGVPDLPYKVQFKLSKTRGVTWANTLDYTFTLQDGFDLSSIYESPLIELGDTYNSIQMVMIQHQRDRDMGHAKLFGFSEFQLYTLKDDSPSNDEVVKTAKNNMDAVLEKINEKGILYVTTSDVDELQNAITELKKEIKLYNDRITGIVSKKVSNNNCLDNVIYDVNGRYIASPATGINIINGKMVIME
ncbi:MAG: hypothetical protein KBT27_03585 [Prevotellaceae bacterium]|nr:hypothetical protein [Candidatus Faecinaster equi]